MTPQPTNNTQSNELQYCNWSFDEFVDRGKWLIKRDCEDKLIPLNRGDTKNYKAYKASLQPQIQERYEYPRPGAQCPNCHKEINGVNPYDDGETWRK